MLEIAGDGSWIAKVPVGETGADYLIFQWGLGLPATSALMSVVLVAILWLQFRQDRYRPWVYWLAVTMVSVVGTLITDSLVDTYGVPLPLTTVVFAVALIATFAIWYGREGTLSIHAIDTPPREGFYWLAILFTFALGTAAGDLMAERLGLGAWAVLPRYWTICGSKRPGSWLASCWAWGLPSA